MFSTKFWFTLVVLVLGASVATILVSRDTHNRARSHDTQRLLLKDRNQAWALLKSEARVRIDEVLRISNDPVVMRVLSKASTKGTELTSDDRATLAAAMQTQNESMQDFSADLLVALDRTGEAIAAHWPDGPDKVGRGLAGFPAVQSALRGFVQDDIWSLSLDADTPDAAKVYRIAARPVIANGRYVGAVVHGQSLDAEFANTLAQRLKAQVLFFRGSVILASGQPGVDGFVSAPDQVVATPIERLLQPDQDFLTKGRSSVEFLQGDAMAVYTLVVGEAARIEGSNVGYAIVRTVPRMESALEFVTGATAQDWQEMASSTPGIILFTSLFFVLLLGFVFFSVEHGRPLKKLRKAIDRLAAREVDRINIYGVSRKHRRLAESINKAIDKAVQDVAEKLGKKPADIDQILGPSDGQDRVSSALFTFPDGGGEEIPPPPPGSEGGSPGAPAVPGAPPAAPVSAPAAPVPTSAPAAPVAAPAPSPAAPAPLGTPAAAPPMPSDSVPPADDGGMFGGMAPLDLAAEEDEDKTEIAGVPEELLRAAQRDEVPPPIDENAYFHQIFEEFVAAKKRCGERTDNLQYERFSQTLQRNRDALIERYGCKSVRFQVYVKEGKAALKATPVRG